ncbi:hypothetical protein ACIP2X_37345 [Streptomyces sp. NPDC089424]|uniref:hypothetical protein n=1 Tax=Streptomyces sp. NPDC089424 TaxID=3365917 RepID=UPI003829E68B
MNLRTLITGSVPGTVQITAYVSCDTRKELDGLKPFFVEQRARARGHPMASTAGLTRREADARRGQWEDRKTELRRSGVLIDSRDALVTGGLCLEIEQRGWNREWEPFPPQARAPGRSAGSPDGAWEKSVTVRLPVDLVNTVYAACWHTSKEARTLLEEWKRRHPKACPKRTSRPGCDEAALDEYRQICAKITHRGDLWRAAVLNGLDKARASQDPATGMP